MLHITYFYCVKNFGNIFGLNDIPWCVHSSETLLASVTCFFLLQDVAGEFPYIELETYVLERCYVSYAGIYVHVSASLSFLLYAHITALIFFQVLNGLLVTG